jgi:hypothetical protein
MKTQLFIELSAAEACDIEAGNFAYDVGRVIRFIILTGPTGSGLGGAYGDWVANEAANSAT